MTWVYDDGGRKAAGFRGETGDCVTRAVAIAAGLPYREVYDDLWEVDRAANGRRASGPRDGFPTKLLTEYLAGMYFEWPPTMFIGSGCQVHLRADELPTGGLIARVTRHVCAVIDGVIYDTHDPSRDGTRCVYGYWGAP